MSVRALCIAVATPVAVMISAPSLAQDNNSNNAATAQRVDRLERELRAVQRRVFPGSENGLFTPEVQPQDAAPSPVGGGTSAVGDLAARLDALEASLARLTGQVEQQGNHQREIDAAIAQLRAELDARIDVLESEDAAAPVASAPVTVPTPTPATTRPTPAATPATRPAATAATPATRAPANAARRARVEAIEVPSTGNAAEDAYLYGYRLWDAHLYPEAQAQLQRVVEQYPTHRRASFAGNLLGRAYLDNNQPSLAVQAFYNNYHDRPRGERAPDSVYYMGMALIQLNRLADACRTFDEIDRVYGSTATQELKDKVATARGQAHC